MNRRDLEAMTKKELSLLARDANVAGRSTMTKAQIVDALAQVDSEPDENVTAEVVDDGLGISIPGISHEDRAEAKARREALAARLAAFVEASDPKRFLPLGVRRIM